MKWYYPPYSGAPVHKARALSTHAGHTLTVVRTERAGTLLYCLTCGCDVLDIEPAEDLFRATRFQGEAVVDVTDEYKEEPHE